MKIIEIDGKKYRVDDKSAKVLKAQADARTERAAARAEKRAEKRAAQPGTRRARKTAKPSQPTQVGTEPNPVAEPSESTQVVEPQG